MRRTVLAGLVGGLVVFVWGAIAHMLLPLGETGISTLPDVESEQALLGEMKSRLHEGGLYFFPGAGYDAEDEASQAAFQQRLEAGPTGFLVFRPDGAEMMSPRQLGTELASNIAGACIAAFVVVRMRSGFLGRVLAVGFLGVFAWLSIEASYWTWYRFPSAYATAQLVDQSAGWLLAGIAIAALTRSRAEPAS